METLTIDEACERLRGMVDGYEGVHVTICRGHYHNHSGWVDVDDGLGASVRLLECNVAQSTQSGPPSVDSTDTLADWEQCVEEVRERAAMCGLIFTDLEWGSFVDQGAMGAATIREMAATSTDPVEYETRLPPCKMTAVTWMALKDRLGTSDLDAITDRIDRLERWREAVLPLLDDIAVELLYRKPSHIDAESHFEGDK